LRILITNNALDKPAGSEIYVRDLAIGLLKRGYTEQDIEKIGGGNFRKVWQQVLDGAEARSKE